MADERIAFAGDLTTDALGRRVRVMTESGVVIEDVVLDIRYFYDHGRDLSAMTAEGTPKVWLRFKNATPADAFMRGDYGNGFLVDQTAHAVVGSTPDPEKYFAIGLHLSAVRHEDFPRLHDALTAIRNEFSRGGSSLSVESVTPKTVVHR